MIMRLNENYFDDIEKTDALDSVTSYDNTKDLFYKYSFLISTNLTKRQVFNDSHPQRSDNNYIIELIDKDFKKFEYLVSHISLFNEYNITIESYASIAAYYNKKDMIDSYEPNKYIHTFLPNTLPFSSNYDTLAFGFKVDFNPVDELSLKNFMKCINLIRSFALSSNLFQKSCTNWLVNSENKDDTPEEMCEPTQFQKSFLRLNTFYQVYDGIYETDYTHDDKGFEQTYGEELQKDYSQNTKFTKWLIIQNKHNFSWCKEFNIKVDGYGKSGGYICLILDMTPTDPSKHYEWKDVAEFIYDTFITKMDYHIFKLQSIIITIEDSMWIENIDSMEKNTKRIAHDDELNNSYYLCFGDGCGKVRKLSTSTSTRDEYIQFDRFMKNEWKLILDGRNIL